MSISVETPLRDRLRAAGKTQHELSLATGISASTISRYVNELRPTPEHTDLIEAALRGWQR